MSFIKAEDCGERKMGEETEEDRESKVRSEKKYMQAVRSRLESSTAGKPWEMLNILLHEEYDTYEEALKKQEELVKAQKDGMYAVITLQESNELTVIPVKWLNEEKTQCYWPPFKSPEKFLEAVKNRLLRTEPSGGDTAWERLNIDFHGEYATYEQAKEKQEAVSEQKLKKRPSASLESVEKQKTKNPSSMLTSWSTQSGVSTVGVKRKREESDISSESLPTTGNTDVDTRRKAKQIMSRVNEKVQNIKSTDHTITTFKANIVDAISKMNKIERDTRRKATIGIFGQTGEGKTSLLNAVLGKESLLPSGSFGACTAVITQVEANLSDSNYTAEIEFISEEEWENEIASSHKNENRDNEMTETIKERINAVFGADADKKTLEELKRDDKYTEIENVLSNKKKIISSSNPSEFANQVDCYLEHSSASPGNWYWPLVKSVTIKVPNLLEHIVLLDLPGTGDCSKIRDDLWKSKLSECSSVWIVSDIKRAITDKDPWGILEHCIEDLGPGGECKSINFICTKTDDIKPTEYLRSIQLTEAQITGDGLDVETQCILHRNKMAKAAIKHKLESSKSKESKDRFITAVFTVSSTAYFDHKAHLKRAESEIPRLQNVLMSLNKSINQKLTRDYINEAKGVLSLIQSVQLDTDENMTKDRVLKDLQTNLEKELKKLGCQFDSLYKVLEECLSKGVKESVTSCVKTTHDMLASIRPKTNKGFHKPFRAMCERGGCYWPRNWNEPIDLNKCLTKHMYDNINEEFKLIFPVDDNDKTEKSMQDQVDKFNIIQCVFLRSSILRPIEVFIKTQETKLKVKLNQDIVEKKKYIYSSIKKTIQKKMALGYKKAAEERGEGCMERMEKIITETIEQLKTKMFNEAKGNALEMFNELKVHIMKTLESELKSSVERSLSQTSKISLLDVSSEAQELDRLSEHLRSRRNTQCTKMAKLYIF